MLAETRAPTTDVPTALTELVAAYAYRTPLRSVAVVGNAPVRRSVERAAAIDGCDLVFRVNGFALDTPDAAPAVGRRADVVTFTRGVQATPWLFQNYRQRLYLLVEPGRMHWEPADIPDWWPPDLGWVPVPNRDVTLALSEALGIDSVGQPKWATTGTVTAWLASRMFPDAELHLAGFSFVDDPTQTSWAHAYGDPCELSAEHTLGLEAALFRRWIAAGTAVLH